MGLSCRNSRERIGLVNRRCHFHGSPGPNWWVELEGPLATTFQINKSPRQTLICWAVHIPTLFICACAVNTDRSGICSQSPLPWGKMWCAGHTVCRSTCDITPATSTNVIMMSAFILQKKKKKKKRWATRNRTLRRCIFLSPRSSFSFGLQIETCKVSLMDRLHRPTCYYERQACHFGWNSKRDTG